MARRVEVLADTFKFLGITVSHNGRQLQSNSQPIDSSLLISFPTTQAYKNYTVGDDLGWYDDVENPKVDYQKWVDGKNFSLGDFLNSSDTVEYSLASPGNGISPTTIPIPLKKEGINCFFSSLFNGEQCRNGQRFKINVTHGQGLPESLIDPIDSSSPPPDDDNTVPDTNISSNFNHPLSSSDAGKQTSDSGGNSGNLASFGRVPMVVLALCMLLI